MKNLPSGQSRRAFLCTLGGFGLVSVAGCTTVGEPTDGKTVAKLSPRSSKALYRALPNEKFPIPAIKPGQLKPQYHRQRVRYRTSEKPGTVVVDTRNYYLYHVEPGGKAMRYGVGLGRAGFAWSGRARIAWKRKWPKWTPPDEMIRRGAPSCPVERREWRHATWPEKPARFPVRSTSFRAIGTHSTGCTERLKSNPSDGRFRAAAFGWSTTT